MHGEWFNLLYLFNVGIYLYFDVGVLFIWQGCSQSDPTMTLFFNVYELYIMGDCYFIIDYSFYMSSAAT